MDNKDKSVMEKKIKGIAQTLEQLRNYTKGISEEFGTESDVKKLKIMQNDLYKMVNQWLDSIAVDAPPTVYLTLDIDGLKKACEQPGYDTLNKVWRSRLTTAAEQEQVKEKGVNIEEIWDKDHLNQFNELCMDSLSEIMALQALRLDVEKKLKEQQKTLEENMKIVKKETTIKSNGMEQLNDNEDRAIKYISNIYRTAADGYLNKANSSNLVNKSINLLNKIQYDSRPMHTEFFKINNELLSKIIAFDIPKPLKDSIVNPLQKELDSLKKTKEIIDSKKATKNLLTDKKFNPKVSKFASEDIIAEDVNEDDEDRGEGVQEIKTGDLIASVELETIRMQSAVDSRNLIDVQKALKRRDSSIESKVLEDLKQLNENKEAAREYEKNILSGETGSYLKALSSLRKYKVPTNYKYLVKYLETLLRLHIVKDNLEQKVILPPDKLNSLRSRIQKDIKKLEDAYYNRSTPLDVVNTYIFNCRDSFYEVMKTINSLMKHDPEWQGIPNKILDNIEHAGRLWHTATGKSMRDQIDEASYKPLSVARLGIQRLEEMKFDKETEFLRTYAIAYMNLLKRKVELQNERSKNAKLADNDFKNKVLSETEKMTQLLKSVKLSEVSDFLSIIETRKDSILKSVESKIKDFGFGKVLEQINHLMMADKSEDRLVSMQGVDEIHVPDDWKCLKSYLSAYLRLKFNKIQLERNALKNSKSNITKNAQPTVKSNTKFETKKSSINPFFKPENRFAPKNLPVLKDTNNNQIKKLSTMSPLQPMGLKTQDEINNVTPQINRVNSMPLSDVSMPDDNYSIDYDHLDDVKAEQNLNTLCSKIKQISKLSSGKNYISAFFANLLGWAYYNNNIGIRFIGMFTGKNKKFKYDSTLKDVFEVLKSFLKYTSEKTLDVKKIIKLYGKLLCYMYLMTLKSSHDFFKGQNYKNCIHYFAISFFNQLRDDVNANALSDANLNAFCNALPSYYANDCKTDKKGDKLLNLYVNNNVINKKFEDKFKKILKEISKKALKIYDPKKYKEKK